MTSRLVILGGLAVFGAAGLVLFILNAMTGPQAILVLIVGASVFYLIDKLEPPKGGATSAPPG